ncbi:MAG: F0F1 ATP synthase subunit A [Actinomycetota bacterium]|nr:F0F1 ATP synthase subunit A [Actinomycetota bacterium]
MSLFLSAAPHVADFQPPDVQHSFFFDAIGNGSVIASVKAMVLFVIGVGLIIAFFMASARRAAVLPTKMQFAGESLYGFVRNGIAVEVMGKQGKKWAGFLASMFAFLLVMNLWEIVPIAQLPVTSHFAVPVFLALLVWIIYNAAGIRKHGFLGYLKLQTYIPGIPLPMHFLLIPIEFLSNIILRPFTLAVRLFANMFAGHMLVGVAAAGTTYLLLDWRANSPFFVLPFAASMILVFFELMVGALQAYVFTLLTAIYLEGSLADSH